MRAVLVLLLILAGAGGGLVAGTMLRPTGTGGPGHVTVPDGGADAEPVKSAATPAGNGDGHSTVAAVTAAGYGAGKGDDATPTIEGREYVKIGRQIIVPVVDAGETIALMLFDLAVDVPGNLTGEVYAAEPRLRDAFLRVLFEFSHTGAFSGTYTDERVMTELRGRLRDAARSYLGTDVADVLILDVMRQEM